MKTKTKMISLLIGIGSAVLLFLLFGSVAAVVPNAFFTRMTSVGWLEWTILVTTSVLLGVFIALTYYDKRTKTVCTANATAGGVFGFLTFGCAVCNKVLIFLLGAAGVMTYFEPVRPFLGVVSVGLLGGSVVYKINGLR